MNILNSLLIAMVVFGGQLNARHLTAEEVTSLHDEINHMMERFEAGDAQALIDRTHPSLMKLSGGKEQFEKTIRDAVKGLLQMNIQFLESDLGVPTELYQVGEEELCFVPRVSVMQIDGKRAKSTSFMISVRRIGSTEWKFLDGSGLRKNPQLLKMLFPEIDPSIVWPTIKTELL